jgi:hypothetical protein
MKKLLMLLLMLALTGQAFADGWTPPLTVEKAFTEDTDNVILYTADGTVYTPGCNANNWVIVANSETRRGRAWAAILSALATGQKVQLWYTSACGVYGFHQAVAVMLLKGP